MLFATFLFYRIQSTAVPVVIDVDNSPADSFSAGAGLDSSMDEPVDDDDIIDDIHRYRRQATSTATLISTTTVTSTSFSFSITSVTKTVSIAAANGLTCLPTGFVVCV